MLGTRDQEVSMRRFMEDAPVYFGIDIILTIGSALLLALTLAPAANAALIAPAPVAAPDDACSMKLKTLQFAGTFDWKNARTGKTEKLRFVIGTPAQSAAGTTRGASVAQIWSGKQCQASCS